MTIFDELNFTNIDLGDIQSIEEMTVVPILGRDRTERISHPDELKFSKTSTYGSMVWTNESEKDPAIIPSNIMIRGTGAQDHAMSVPGIVAKKSTTSFDEACCIEETQGGTLNDKNNQVDILPIGLRKILLKKEIRTQKEYSKLWRYISNWLKGIPNVESHKAHLRYFYDQPDYKKILEENAMHFEPVKHQIGALIMFGGNPVGIEIMPTNAHWNHYWKYLVRGCYGAELLRLKLLGKINSDSLAIPDLPVGSPEQVESFIDAFMFDLRNNILPILDTIKVDKVVKVGAHSTLNTGMVQTTAGGGDIIFEGHHPIYLSLVI